MEKKQLTLVVVSLLVVVLSVSVAYFTAQIIGEGKEVSVTSANLQIVFEDTDGAISDTSIEPGWTSTKTFTVTNNSKNEYKYNIVLKDLVNTFVTEGYLQYKITSTNSGYNMTEFKDVPKSSTVTDTVLAYSVSIPNSVSQEYTITFQYLNDEDIDQSDDMGMKLSGSIFITEGTKEPPTLYEQLLADKTERSITTRPGGFTGVYTSDNTKTLYTSTENGTTVYYFAGNATDNWVKLGKFYWRIIRTNADGGIRLLYHSTSTTAEDAYIGESVFNYLYNSPKYVGYMYGDTDTTLDETRTNANVSEILNQIYGVYQYNLTNYTKYLSETAVYCNDREVGSGNYSTIEFNDFYYKAYTRLETNKTPTYDCTNINDKFTVSPSTGNGKLIYPIGLITADEIVFAGGLWTTNASAYYYKNSAGNSSTGGKDWWTMSPSYWDGLSPYMFAVAGSSRPGYLDNNADLGSILVLRPVTSLKSCVKWSAGDGTPENPYTISETESGC